MRSLLNPCGTSVPTSCVVLLPTAKRYTSHLTGSDNIPTESVWAGEKRPIFALTPTDRPVVTPGRQGFSHSLASDALWSLQYVAVVTGKLDAGADPAEVEMTVRKRSAIWVTSAPNPLCPWPIPSFVRWKRFLSNFNKPLVSSIFRITHIKCRTCNSPWFFL